MRERQGISTDTEKNSKNEATRKSKTERRDARYIKME